MRNRVDTEGGLLYSEGSYDAGIDESAPPITPKTSDTARQDEPHNEGNFCVMIVLPDDNRIPVQIRDINAAEAFGILSEDQPSDVSVKKTLTNRIRILIGICVAVMGAMVSTPCSDRIFYCATANSSKPDLERKAGSVGPMRP